MKGIHHPKNDTTVNPSGNESVRELLDHAGLSRRKFVQLGVSAPTLAALGGVTTGGLIQTMSAAPIPASVGFAGIGFESIPPSVATLSATGAITKALADRVAVPPGYQVSVLAAWGDPIMPGAPMWAPNASQDAASQAKQFGMHNDGMHFFGFPEGSGVSSTRGLLCVNHEYTHEAILYPDGLDEASGGLPGSIATIDKIRKSQAAHGVAVVEIQFVNGKWEVLANSPYGRRITANTPMKISGPAAGHDLLKTKEYRIQPGGSVPLGTTSDGTVSSGTANNCANGYTPWGTFLTCEENWNSYFGWKNSAHTQTRLEKRYGVTKDGSTKTLGSVTTAYYKWHVLDDRFDTDVNPNEQNTFGWIVEIDPWNPTRQPVKRTSLGRKKNESCTLATDTLPSRRFAFYIGDDERDEYVYKWVCNREWDPASREANRDLLDDGILYVAKFSSTAGQTTGTYRGSLIALLPGTDTVIDDPAAAGRKRKLRELDELGANDAEVLAKILIKTRMAADAVGATMMDRPEWTAVRPRISGFTKLEIYLTLTNNNRRGNTPVSSINPDGSTTAATANPPVDVANPRPDNDYGHIIRWREDGDTVTATAFEWDIFCLCGDTQAASHVPNPKTLGSSYTQSGHDGYAGNINDAPANSADFGAPDGLWFDYFGRLWIQTDQPGDGAGDFQKIGSNTMLCADPNTKEVRRFLTSPNQCEVTGVTGTPDGKTMFVGIQHPGEESLSANPAQYSSWPGNQFGGPTDRPRAAVLAITRTDGGVVGT